jgi:hypothetical protein
VQWLLLRAELYVCDECSGPIYFWNRRVWLAKNERCAHVSCSQSRRFFSEYLQATAEAAHKFESLQDPTLFREDARAKASELRVAVLRLEQAIYGSDFSDAKPHMKEVLVLARALDGLLRQWPDYAQAPEI